MSIRVQSLLVVGAAAAIAAPLAHANTVRYQIGGNLVVVVADGSPNDLDPLPNRIKVSINADGSIGGAKFHVTATITAKADPPITGKPTLDFPNLTITNTQGNVMGGTMWVQHDFTAIDKPSQWSAKIAGKFDSLTNPGNLGGASLNHLSKVYSGVGGWKTVVNLNSGLFAGAAPVPFSLAGGPAGWKIASKQRTDLAFYLDSPGDSIIVISTDNSRFYVALLPLLAIPASWHRRRLARPAGPTAAGRPCVAAGALRATE